MIVTTIDEVKEFISVTSENEFSLIKPFIKRAEKYVIRVIGQPVYDDALDHYESMAVDETLDDLVENIQAPVILYAYYLYSPQANVIVTDSGVQVAWSDNFRPAQEWQYDKMESSIRDTAHEHVDDLLEFLDDNEDDIASWKNSDAQKFARSLLINNAIQFSQVYDINNSRRMFLELISLINESEIIHVLPIVGQTKFDELKSQIETDGVVSAENEALYILIKPALAYITMSEAMLRLSAEIIPSGIFENLVSKSETRKAKDQARIEVLNGVSEWLKKKADIFLSRLQNHVNILANEDIEEEEDKLSTENIPDNSDTTKKTFRV